MALIDCDNYSQIEPISLAAHLWASGPFLNLISESDSVGSRQRLHTPLLVEPLADKQIH